MPNPPKELLKQIEIINEVSEKLDDLITNKKIKLEFYGKQFLEPLNEVRTKAMELRNELDVFKNNMESAISEQYYNSDRFANEKAMINPKRVVDSFLSRG
jgi:hypothetical protein